MQPQPCPLKVLGGNIPKILNVLYEIIARMHAEVWAGGFSKYYARVKCPEHNALTFDGIMAAYWRHCRPWKF